MPDLPVVCSLTPDALAARRIGLLANLIARTSAREVLADGMRLIFPPGGDVLMAIARAIDAERQCCRFLRFTIAVEPDDGPVVVELTGPPGTREFLSDLFPA